MKTIKIYCLMMVLISTVFYNAQAQNTKKDKQAAKEAAIKKIIEDKTYNFAAQSATPLRGGSIQLSYGYHLLVNKDTVIAYLPYFGRAYIAPMDPLDNGIEFTSGKINYKYGINKNGYEISIQPTDTKDVKLMYLEVSTDGYATLRVANLNRDAITFNGYLEAIKPPKQSKK